MAIRTPLEHQSVARHLAEHYPGIGELVQSTGLEAGSVNTNYRLETTSGRYFLRLYEEQDRAGAEREAELVRELSRRGVPTPAALATRQGRWVTELSGRPSALLPWVDGRVLCHRETTTAHAREIGRQLAAVHALGPQALAGPNRFDEVGLRERLRSIGDARPSLSADVRDLERKLERYAPALDLPGPRGVVHADLFRDNVLWDDGGALVALLDFESAHEGPFAFDVMVTVHAWCFDASFDWPRAEALVTAYCGEHAIVAPPDSWHDAAAWAAVRFAVTRLTDFELRVAEDEEPLRDYRRFLRRLDEIEALGPVGLTRKLGL